MVKTPCFYAGGMGLIPGWGTRIQGTHKCGQNFFLREKEESKTMRRPAEEEG